MKAFENRIRIIMQSDVEIQQQTIGTLVLIPGNAKTIMDSQERLTHGSPSRFNAKSSNEKESYSH